jgi:type IV secretion system protein VirD4
MLRRTKCLSAIPTNACEAATVAEPTRDDRTLAAILASFGGAGLLVHAVTLLAARASGGHQTISLSATYAALPALPTHLGHPGDAWTPAIQMSPMLFWPILSSTSAIAIAVTYYAMSHLNIDSRSRIGVRMHGGLAKTRDLRRLRIAKPTAGRIVLGKLGRRLIATENQTSLAVIGPTGCGKTAGFAIPALLEWEGPVITTSVKTDILSTTLAHRRTQGKVWIFDPSECSGEQPSLWNPLDFCTTWDGAQRMAAWMCESAQPRLDTVSDGDYWYTQARKALGPYLYAGATHGLAMSDIVSWIDRQEQEAVERILRNAASVDGEMHAHTNADAINHRRAELVATLRDDHANSMRQWFSEAGPHFSQYADKTTDEWPTVFQAQLDERVSQHAKALATQEAEAHLSNTDTLRVRMAPLISIRSLWEKDQRLRDSVFATVENVVAPYGQIAYADPLNTVNLAQWIAGNNTIYVVASSHDQARLRPVLTTFVQQVMRFAFDAATQNGGTLPQSCLALLDEAGNIAPLRDLPAYASTARSHRISLVTIWQDLAQIKAIYRDRAQTVINNHRAKLFGTGIADEHTLEYVSRLIGDVAMKEHNTSRDLNSDRRSLSEHTTYRRAAPMDVLRRIKPNEAILLYGSELPTRLRLRPWYADRELRALASETKK